MLKPIKPALSQNNPFDIILKILVLDVYKKLLT